MLFLIRILCVGPLSRLFVELREKRGLIYQIFPNNMYTHDGFLVGIVTQTDIKNRIEVKEAILHEIQSIAEKGVLELELLQTKNRHFQTMERQNDSTESLCAEYAEYYRKFKEIYVPEKEIELVNSLSKKDIQKSAQVLLKKDIIWVEMVPE